MSGKYKAVASGAITNGKPVIVNSTGTVSVVTDALSQALGANTNIGSGKATKKGSAFDSNSNRVVIAYKNDGNSDFGEAIVGTVNTANNTISYGTAVVFESAVIQQSASVFDSNSNRIVIVYEDEGNSSHGTAIVGTVDPSDNSISFGTAVVFNSTGTTNLIDATFDSSNNKVVVVYRDVGNSNYGTAIVGAVDPSDNSISFGSEAVFESAAVNYVQCTFDSSNNKVVIAYMDDANSDQGTAIVGTVDSSDNSISFGSAAIFNNAATNYINITFDSTANKVVFIYSDIGNSKYLTARVGTVSGTSIGSFGSEVVFQSQWAIAESNGTAFDANASKVIVGFRNVSGNAALIGIGTVSGSSISFATNVNLNGGNLGEAIASVFASNRVVMAFTVGNAVGNSKVLQNVAPTTLTTENYIGIASGGTYPTASGATIDIVGTVNKDQSGLTAGQTYFVQTDGTLGTSADDPSVVAGTAISATELIVKG